MKKWKQVRKKNLNAQDYVEEFWRKNKEKLIETHKHAQPLSTSNLKDDVEGTAESKFKARFVNGTLAYMENNEGMDVQQALKSHLNSRSYKTQEEYYDESFIKRLKANRKAYYNVKRNFKTGYFEHVDWKSATYQGKVEIDGVIHTKYSIETASGTKYVYFTDSPNGEVSEWIVSMENIK